MTFSTQTVESTEMAPIWVAGREWQCRADRKHRFQRIYESLDRVTHLPGDIAEMGCWIGLTSFELARYLEDLAGRPYNAAEKTLHCFESFQGLDEYDAENDSERGEWIALPDMREQFDARMLKATRWKLHAGHLKGSGFDQPLCWAYVDVDIYGPTLDAIEILKRCIVPGGIAVFDDFGAPWWPGVQKAVEENLVGWELERIPDRDWWLCFARRL